MINVGKTIRRLRIDRDLSQGDLAAEADITAPYLSLIENGRREPSLAALRRLARALDVAEEVIIWDAVELPCRLSAKDRRLCELAKIIVRQLFEATDGSPLGQKPR
jgi:transcriptional regulator with XRE-family HTH domain